MAKRLNIAVLLSGGGSTLANLLDCRARGDLEADIGIVISSRPGVKGLQIAADAGIRTEVVDARSFPAAGRSGRDWEGMSRELDRILLSEKYDLVCMAGFLCRYLFAEELNGKVLNIHPSLIPMFCGEGMYGHKVHEAVVAAGVRVSGCTVHFADHAYDTGPIIVQRCCPVFSNDSPDEVARRVFREECRAYPEAINLIARGRVRPAQGRRVCVDGDESVERFTRNVD